MFAYYQEKISYQDLIDALVWQRRQRPVLGAIASKWGWLSEQQVDRHAHKVSTSPLYLVQQAIFLLKMYAGFAWGEQQAVRESLALAPYPAHQPAWRQ